MIERLFDPTVFLSLAMALYAGALWIWFVRRNPVRAVLVLAAGCALSHLTLQRYHSLLNSPSLHLLLSLFWLTPLFLFVLRGRLPGESASDSADRWPPPRQPSEPATRSGWAGRWSPSVIPALVCAYVLLILSLYAAANLSELLFVLLLQPGLLLVAVYIADGRRDPAYIFAALAFFYALLWYLAYAPLAPAEGAGDSSGALSSGQVGPEGGAAGDEYEDPARMWPVQRGYLALLWAIAPFAILRDAIDRSRMMVLGALVLFSALIQFQMGSLVVYCAGALIGGGLLAGPRMFRRS
ncbi:MAG: hypothetical protein RIF32_16525 [Leptospirales bacterium]|jgi:hypothetical protein